MPTFRSPEPVAVALDIAMGDVRITASEGEDTVVSVRPSSDSAKSVKLAEQTVVEFDSGRLIVKTPKQLTNLFGRPGSVDVDIQVPAGSSLDGHTGLGDLTTEGRLGAVRFRSGMGVMRIADTGPLTISTGAGDVSVVSVDGEAEVTTGTGHLRLGSISGTATVKNSNGEIRVGELAKGTRLTTSNGDILVERVLEGVLAKTARGSIRVREAVRGKVEMLTSFGELEIGIPEGTAAWLDLDTPGGIHNALEAVEGPGDAAEKVVIHARTRFGDILIHRS